MTSETSKPPVEAPVPRTDRQDDGTRRRIVPDRDLGDADPPEPVPEPGDSLIHVSLGEPLDTQAAASPAPLGDNPAIDRASLRERDPDIDLGERRRRPRTSRNVPFVPPEPLSEGEPPPRRDLIEVEERQVDAADELRFHEQSLAFERCDADDGTSRLIASGLGTDRGIVYRDLSGHELSATVDLLDETLDPHGLSAARATPGSYGLMARVYERLIGLLGRIPIWFGIRDERTGRDER